MAAPPKIDEALARHFLTWGVDCAVKELQREPGIMESLLLGRITGTGQKTISIKPYKGNSNVGRSRADDGA